MSLDLASSAGGVEAEIRIERVAECRAARRPGIAVLANVAAARRQRVISTPWRQAWPEPHRDRKTGLHRSGRASAERIFRAACSRRVPCVWGAAYRRLFRCRPAACPAQPRSVVVPVGKRDRIEIGGDLGDRLLVGGADQPHHQKQRHHGRHEIGIGDFPGAAMMALVVPLAAPADDDDFGRRAFFLSTLTLSSTDPSRRRDWSPGSSAPPRPAHPRSSPGENSATTFLSLNFSRMSCKRSSGPKISIVMP